LYQELLKCVDPHAAVVSSDERNRVHGEIKKLIASSKIELLETCEKGAIIEGF